MGRTRNSAVNMSAAFFGQGAALAVSFAARTVFVRMLSTEYLGIDGLFSNILNMLSLAELGLGSAVAYSLYRPVARGDRGQVQAILAFFRKAYTAVGLFIIGLSLFLSPFLDILIKDPPHIPELRLYFLLFAVNNALSYFFASRRALIIAEQKAYLDTFFHQGFFILRKLGQIAVLILTSDFLLYLLVLLACTLLENLFLFSQAGRLFPYLREHPEEPLKKEIFREIGKNTLAMVFHKIGSVVVFGTDNLLISRLVGIKEVGLCSNYFLITGALNNIIGRVFYGLLAPVGNAAATESPERNLFFFRVIDLAVFWAYGTASVCLFLILDPFITLWLGKAYILSLNITAVITLNFYLTGMRRGVQLFRAAYGLFWHDRYKALFEALINIGASLAFYPFFGTAGIFLGTSASTLLTAFWVEPYILYRHGFHSPVGGYFARYFLKTLVLFSAAAAAFYVAEMIPAQTVQALVWKILVCVILSNGIFAAAFYRTAEFRFLADRLFSLIGRQLK